MAREHFHDAEKEPLNLVLLLTDTPLELPIDDPGLTRAALALGVVPALVLTNLRDVVNVAVHHRVKLEALLWEGRSRYFTNGPIAGAIRPDERLEITLVNSRPCARADTVGITPANRNRVLALLHHCGARLFELLNLEPRYRGI